MIENNDFNALIFRGQQLIQVISERRVLQRELTYQFIALAAGLFWLTRLRHLSKCQIVAVSIFICIASFGSAYFLLVNDVDLLDARKKLVLLWEDESFATVSEKGVIFKDKEEKENYLSRKYIFTHYTVFYMLTLFITPILLIYLMKIYHRRALFLISLYLFLFVLYGALSWKFDFWHLIAT
jgi:hypothetical protein